MHQVQNPETQMTSITWWEGNGGWLFAYQKQTNKQASPYSPTLWSTTWRRIWKFRLLSTTINC